MEMHKIMLEGLEANLESGNIQRILLGFNGGKMDSSSRMTVSYGQTLMQC